MENLDWNTWGPPIVVLLLGLVVGLISALRVQSGRDSRPVEVQVALAARKASLVEQLREHDGDRHKTDDSAWLVRREALLTEASDVLRQLEEGVPETAAEAPTTAGRKVTLAWGGGLLVFFGLAAGGVSQFASERADDDSMTGNTSAGGSTDPYAADVAAAEARLAQEPDHVASLNLLAHVAIERKALQEAMGLIDRVKAIDETDREMRVHVDALRLLIGMADKAQASLEALLIEDPELSEAMRWLSYARFAQGDLDGAVGWLEKAQGVGSERDRLVAQAWLLELRAAQAQLAAGGGAAPSAAAPQAAGANPKVQGTISLGEGVQALSGGRMFVLARAAETERGPPLAAVPVDTSALPVAFGLGSGELIRGGDWPDQVWLKAKWSAGGDPMTTQPGDLVTGLIGPISTGDTDVVLVLTVAE